MTTLAQLLAVDQGVRNKAQTVENELYKTIQKPQLFAGLSRTYQKKDDEGDEFPPEWTLVQVKSEDVLTELSEAVTRLIDVNATKDASNCLAKADIVVDDVVFAADVPVTTLMALGHVIENLTTFVGKIPTLDPAQRWEYDTTAGCFASEPAKTVKTKKIPKNHIKYEATEQHPAQVELFTEDVKIGEWTKIDFSGALKADRVNGILGRLEKLRQAVKFAREKANTIEVVDVHYGETILDFAFNEGGL